MLNDLDKQIESVLSREIVNRHSYFQLKYFVINAEYTHQSRLWRCLKELQARKESMESIMEEIDNRKDDLELLHIALSKIDPNANEENPIHIRKTERQMKNIKKRINKLEKSLSETKEEACFFVRSYLELEKIEPLKDFDDIESQKLYWSEKFTDELNLRALLGQPPSFELIKSILSLNKDAPIKGQVINMLEGKKNMIAKINQEQDVRPS